MASSVEELIHLTQTYSLTSISLHCYVMGRPILMSALKDTTSLQMKSTNSSQGILLQPEIEITAFPVHKNLLTDVELPVIPNPTESKVNIDTSRNMVARIVTNQNTPTTEKDNGATKNTVTFPPEYVRSGPKQKINRGTPTRTSAIHTDTSEKDAIRLESEARESKKRAQRVKRNITDVKSNGKKSIANKKAIIFWIVWSHIAAASRGNSGCSVPIANFRLIGNVLQVYIHMFVTIVNQNVLYV